MFFPNAFIVFVLLVLSTKAYVSDNLKSLSNNNTIEEQRPGTNGDYDTAGHMCHATVPSSVTPVDLLKNVESDNCSSIAAPTQSISPAFLRGRGRGRPKLIGDELDAELVEYMVQVNVDSYFYSTLLIIQLNLIALFIIVLHGFLCHFVEIFVFLLTFYVNAKLIRYFS